MIIPQFFLRIMSDMNISINELNVLKCSFAVFKGEVLRIWTCSSRLKGIAEASSHVVLN